MELNQQLSPHFSYGEMFYSVQAAKLQINNTPPKSCVINLIRLCNEVLEPIREKFGSPIHVNSGYRCQALNKAVGGATTSFHLLGRAADITASDLRRLKDLVAELVSDGTIKPIEYIEYSSFIHLAL